MNIRDAVFCVVDTETTGLDPEKDQLVEIGAVAVSLRHGNLGMFATLAHPTIPIPAEVSAVHGLTRLDLKDAPSQDEAKMRLAYFLDQFGLDSGKAVLTAHNYEFDAAFLGLDAGLCTKRLAMHLWPAATNHRNQTLRFWRELEPETFGIAPHRALGDALVTAALLVDELTCSEFEAMGITTIEQLIEFAESPIVYETIPFGKHRGETIATLPESYVSWCLREMKDLSRDMRHTLQLRLKAA